MDIHLRKFNSLDDGGKSIVTQLAKGMSIDPTKNNTYVVTKRYRPITMQQTVCSMHEGGKSIIIIGL